MTERIKPSGGSLLQRWSRLKAEARGEERGEPPTAASSVPAMTGIDSANAVTPPGAHPPAGPATRVAAAADADALPPVESLTIDSDFAPFLKPKVDEALKRQALKQLFRDPHFNVMDGLDIYIGDYTRPDPIPPEIVREMVQGRYIFNPPPTRINAQGYVEDVPPEELAALERDGEAAMPEASADAGAAATAQLPLPETDARVPTHLPPLESDATVPTQLSLADLDAPSTMETPPESVSSVKPETAGDSPAATTADPGERKSVAR